MYPNWPIIFFVHSIYKTLVGTRKGLHFLVSKFVWIKNIYLDQFEYKSKFDLKIFCEKRNVNDVTSLLCVIWVLEKFHRLHNLCRETAQANYLTKPKQLTWIIWAHTVYVPQGNWFWAWKFILRVSKFPQILAKGSAKQTETSEKHFFQISTAITRYKLRKKFPTKKCTLNLLKLGSKENQGNTEKVLVRKA